MYNCLWYYGIICQSCIIGLFFNNNWENESQKEFFQIVISGLRETYTRLNYASKQRESKGLTKHQSADLLAVCSLPDSLFKRQLCTIRHLKLKSSYPIVPKY